MTNTNLKSRILNECASDPRFRRGYQLSSELAIALIILRVLSPAITYFTERTVPSMTSDVLFPLLMCAFLFMCAREGQTKFAGVMCVLIGVCSIALGWTNTEIVTTSFQALIDSNRYTQYQMFLSLLCIGLGMIYFTNTNIRLFGNRCKEFAAEINAEYTVQRKQEREQTGQQREEWLADQRRKMKRTMIFVVVAGLVLVILGAGMTGVFTKKYTFDKLDVFEGEYVSIQETSVEGTYRISMEGVDGLVGIANLYNFPIEQFEAEVQPGDMLKVHCKADEWHTVMQLEANGTQYLTYEDVAQTDHSNGMKALAIICCFYVGLMALAVIIFIYKKKQLDKL